MNKHRFVFITIEPEGARLNSSAQHSIHRCSQSHIVQFAMTSSSMIIALPVSVFMPAMFSSG